MRIGWILLWMVLCSLAPASAQMRMSFGISNANIGIDLWLYPELERLPDYPVYYAPRLDSNYFFYDGMYWVYQGDSWFASAWYNGPWWLVAPEEVPYFILRIPVRYYRRPPVYFQGWALNAPPRWQEHWGNDWAQRRCGWDHWDRHAVPAPAPLPLYQRAYPRDRYPGAERRQSLHSQNYRYQPRESVPRHDYRMPDPRVAPTPPRRPTPDAWPDRNAGRERDRRADPPAALPSPVPVPPHGQTRPRGPGNVQPAAPVQAQPRPQPRNSAPPLQRQGPPPPNGVVPRQPPAPGARGNEAGPEGRGHPKEPMRQRHADPKRDQGQGRERER